MKKKREKQKKDLSSKSHDKNEVILGVRVSEAERTKIKMYAVRHSVTVTDLIRKYIDSLPSDD